MTQKVVFTTPVGDYPDYFYISVRRDFFRFSLPTPSFGLRFLKHNIHEIKALEYPKWKQYKKLIDNGVDILGISFYMADIPVVMNMIEYAKENGVKEIWGGNYGILTPGLEKHFDKTFFGYSEKKVAYSMGKKISQIEHPPIITTFGIRNTPFKISHAFLFTTRGCASKCEFCQTPDFCPYIETLPLESIEKVLNEYSKRRVKSVFIMDDNFFGNRKYSENVVNMIYEKGLSWGVCTRASNLIGRVEEFRKKGMFMCIIGVESMSQENLNSVKKGSSVSNLERAVKELKRNHIYIHGTYMIGYENDTKESIINDLDKLSKMGLQSLQISILTPLPGTPLWKKIKKKYGIFEKDYSKFDTYRLVWNHPSINPEQMNMLLKYAWNKLYPRRKIFSNLLTIARNGVFYKFLRP